MFGDVVWTLIFPTHIAMRDILRFSSTDRRTRQLLMHDTLFWRILCAQFKWKQHPADGRIVMARIARNYCRECYTPTRSLADTRDGWRVRLCVVCSKGCAYSRLCGIDTIYDINRQREWWVKKKALRHMVIARLTVARRSRTRMILYWQHEAESLLHTL
jgi:hypothetical protein